MSESIRPGFEAPRSRVRTDRHVTILNVLIVVLVLVVAVLSYALLSRHVFQPPVDAESSGVRAGQIIQLEVLNGCGAQGAAVHFTSYLRARGYDVVEVRNYKTFDVKESLVIDRMGHLGNAEKVAYALGIRTRNIIRQLNADYYVDVSVVIGQDYHSLKPSH